MVIISTNLLSDTILFMRDRLKSLIIDPISTKRPTGEKFVMTSYPREKVRYPIITIKGSIIGDQKLGQQSEQSLVNLAIEVRIWARNEKEKNDLWGEVYNDLRKNQYPTATANTSTNVQLWDFGINFARDLDDPGEEGIKSKISEFRYNYITT